MAYYHSKASGISHATTAVTLIFIFFIRLCTKQAMHFENPIKRYLRLLPQSRREMHSSGLLRSE
jgi:hypothetical protein